MNLTTRNCLWNEKNCPLKNIKKTNKNYSPNFYEDYIKDYFQTDLSKIKSKQCNKCGISINSRWFSNDVSYKIFNSVYGQHHRGWSNYYDFKNNNKSNTHKEIVKKISNIIKIKKYSEFNCPFQGNFFSYLAENYNPKNIKKLIALTEKRILLTQLADKNPKIFKKNFKLQSKINIQIKNLRKNNKKIIEKYLILDHSASCWGNGCISKGVNCRSVAQELFNLKVLNLYEINNKELKFDLFSLFNTLDHTAEPKKILDFALNSSKIVLVFNHADPKVTRQHLFSLQESFLNYLNKKKIYTFNISSTYNTTGKENIVFLCTKNTRIKNTIKKNIKNFF